jgi:hypothetical protein
VEAALVVIFFQQLQLPTLLKKDIQMLKYFLLERKERWR